MIARQLAAGGADAGRQSAVRRWEIAAARNFAAGVHLDGALAVLYTAVTMKELFGRKAAG